MKQLKGKGNKTLSCGLGKQFIKKKKKKFMSNYPVYLH